MSGELSPRTALNAHDARTSYNLVDDIHMGENKELISGVLRGEWGWEGAIMSDYMGCHSCAGSIKAGLDIEMQ